MAPELWISTAPGRARQISHFNREWDGIPLAPIEVVRYASFDGVEIEAGLLKPADYQEGTRIPLVILIHGGPSAKFSDRFRWWAQMLTSHGIAVLCPNIRGSTGYGYEFLVSNRYDWGGADFKDVLAAADYVIGLGVADPDRLGIGGWSLWRLHECLGDHADHPIQGGCRRGPHDRHDQHAWLVGAVVALLRHLVPGDSL